MSKIKLYDHNSKFSWGRRLAWSRIPKILNLKNPGAVAIVGSNPTDPTAKNLWEVTDNPINRIFSSCSIKIVYTKHSKNKFGLTQSGKRNTQHKRSVHCSKETQRDSCNWSYIQQRERYHQSDNVLSS